MRKSYPIHPAADVLPIIDGEERAQLKEALSVRGQLVPIQLVKHKGKDHVLDGRNRQELLQELGIEAKYAQADLRDRTPEEYVADVNLHRRNFTPGQKAAYVLKLIPELKKEARERQVVAGKTGKTPKGATSTAKEAAKRAKVSTRTMERVIAIQKKAPHLIDEIARGKVTPKQAEKKIRNAAQVKQVEAYVPPEGKFNVVTVDFSWEYDDKLDGSDAVRGGLPYPPMKIGEILTFIRKELAKRCDETCVLGNWITGPMSLDLRVGPLVQFELQKLGFKPLHERIWKKTRATGGQFVGLGRPIRWDAEKLQIFVRGDVVFNELGEAHGRPIQQTVFEAPVGAHSEKPQKAYDDLEQLVPYTKRLEMFARKARPGWTGSGAELSQPPAMTSGQMVKELFGLAHDLGVVSVPGLAKPSTSGESAPAQSAPAAQTVSPPVATSGAAFSSGAGLGVPESDRSESKRGKVPEALSIEQLRDRVAKTLKDKARVSEEKEEGLADAVSLAAAINAPPTDEQKRRAAQMLRDGSMTIEKKPVPPGQAVAAATVGASREANGRAGTSSSPPSAAPEDAELVAEEYICDGCGEVFVALEVLSKHSKRCTGVPAAKPGYVPPLTPGSTSAVPDEDLGF